MHANWLRLHFDMFFMTADVTVKKQLSRFHNFSLKLIQKIHLHYLGNNGNNVIIVKLLVRFVQ